MTKRPKVLFSIGLPLLLAGVVVTVGGGSVTPLLTLIFPCGFFLLGLAGISYLTHDEFDKLDAEKEPEGSPGDHKQHILRPEEHLHHGDFAHAH